MSYSCVVCQSGVSRGGRRGAGAGAPGRGNVRKCCSGIPHRASPITAPLPASVVLPANELPRGSVHEPDANRAGGGMPDDAFWTNRTP